MRSFGLIVFVVAAAYVGTLARRGAMHTYLEKRTYEDVYYLPETPSLPFLSLGYREALADLIWLKALVYTGDEYANRGDLENVFRYADAMLALDPKFRGVYSWVGTMGIYRPTGVTLDDHRRTIRFLEAGARAFPDDGEIHWELGATLAYEFAPLLPAASDEQREAQAQANEHFFAASRLGAGPPWIGIASAMQFAQAGQLSRALEHLRRLHAMTGDPELRTRIEARIAELEGEAAAEAMRAASADFEARRRAEFPYTSDSLFLLLSPRMVRSGPAPGR